MKIDIREIIDYCHCPMLYKFRYIDTGHKTKYINTIEKYEHDMHKVAYSLFNLLQSGESVTIQNLKKTWGTLWLGNKTKHEIIYMEPSSWRDTHNERRKRGLEAIIHMFNTYKDNPGFPIAINKSYEVKISNNLILTGTWELIREVKDGKISVIEIIDFKVDDKINNKLHINKDLVMTSASYAFRKTFGTTEDRLAYHGLNRGKIEYTSREESDYQMLIHTVSSVAIAIKNKLFYACPDVKCYTCPYRKVCESKLSYNSMKGE